VILTVITESFECDLGRGNVLWYCGLDISIGNVEFCWCLMLRLRYDMIIFVREKVYVQGIHFRILWDDWNRIMYLIYCIFCISLMLYNKSNKKT
jgi:hypothetical protein